MQSTPSIKPAPRRSHFDAVTTGLLQQHGGPPFDFSNDIAEPAPEATYHEQTLLNALSIPLPQGERFFIATMRDCLEQLTLAREVQDDVRLFMSQESLHLRQHTAYNQLLCDRRGYLLDKLEFPVRFNFEEVNRTRSLQHRLAMTVCLEHITTVLAEAVLRHPSWMRWAGPGFQKLWRWHALEEIDHRSFAFDLYMAQGHPREHLHEVMHELAPKQIRFLEAVLCAMASQDQRGAPAARRWFRESDFLFQVGGPVSFFAERLDAFYRPSFHPATHVGFDSLVDH